jgi:hypothetical protein
MIVPRADNPARNFAKTPWQRGQDARTLLGFFQPYQRFFLIRKPKLVTESRARGTFVKRGRMEDLMVTKRNRRKQVISFDERLQRAAHEARAAAQKLPDGPQRDVLLKKASQAENAAHLNEWLTTPSPQPSK